MIKYLFVIITILFTSSLHAQEDMVFPKTSIGFTPTALLNEFSGFQFSFDRGISDKLNFSTETAYIYTSVNNISAKGFRFRPGVEVFVARSSWVSVVTGFHVNYRYTIGYADTRTIARNGEFNYLDFNRRETESFLGFCLENKLIFKISPRWFINLGGGIGLGSVRQAVTTVSEPTTDSFILGNIDRTWLQPILYTHLNFSYAISL